MNDKIEEKVVILPPFKHMIMTIGELPSSYVETMSYYEMLIWFTNYLGKTVIPAINENGEAVIELQNLFIELQNYVNNYFENLDVQEEINNKLDEMAESGQLTDIIAQYLGLAGMFVFNTVADMKLAENLVNGSKCQTLGYHSINDGGKAIYLIRNITNSDVIDEGSIIALYNENLVAELIEKDKVTPEMFGAYGDDEHDDYQSIQKAINYINGGIVEFQQKTYLIGDSLVLHRGLKLCGISSYGEENSVLKLKNNTNKPIIKTPKANGEESTHYMILENLRIDGNGLNQTNEVILVEFYGAYVGSIIRNVYISNFFGTALGLEYDDVEIDNLWIQNGYTLSNNYAMKINPTIDSNVITTMANINNLYIENYRNKLEGNPRTTEGDRADGLLIYRASNININEFHTEGLKTPVTIDGPSVIKINMFRSIWSGLSTDENSTMIKINDVLRCIYLSNIFRTGDCNFSYWILKDNSVSSNSIINVEFNSDIDKMVLPLYIAEQNSNSRHPIIQYPTFINNAEINIVGSPSNAGYYINGNNGTSYFRQDGQATNIGTSINQLSNKHFITLNSSGNLGDKVSISDPILIATRSSHGYTQAGAIYNLSNPTHGTSLVYQTETGSKYNKIVSVQMLTTAPTSDAHYYGEMALDYTNKKLYVATSIGNGASDWTILN